MHDAEGAAQGKGGDRKGEEAKADKQPKAAPPPEPLVVLRANVALIEKAVAQKEARTLFGRVLRQTAAVRKRLAGADLAAFLEGALPQGAPAQQLLLAAVKQVWRGGEWVWGGCRIKCASVFLSGQGVNEVGQQVGDSVGCRRSYDGMLLLCMTGGSPAFTHSLHPPRALLLPTGGRCCGNGGGRWCAGSQRGACGRGQGGGGGAAPA